MMLLPRGFAPRRVVASSDGTGRHVGRHSDAPPDSELVALRDKIAFLRSEREARTEEIRRDDYLLAGLIERIPELPVTTAGSAPRRGTTRPQSDLSPGVLTTRHPTRWR